MCADDGEPAPSQLPSAHALVPQALAYQAATKEAQGHRERRKRQQQERYEELAKQLKEQQHLSAEATAALTVSHDQLKSTKAGSQRNCACDGTPGAGRPQAHMSASERGRLRLT